MAGRDESFILLSRTVVWYNKVVVAKVMKKEHIYTFRVIIEPDQPKGYHGFVPLLRGVHTCGKTVEEVRKNLREAITCHIRGLRKDQKVIPEEAHAFEFVETVLAK